MATQSSFMNLLEQFNTFTRKNNGATCPAQGPSFFNSKNSFKKNNTFKNNGYSFLRGLILSRRILIMRVKKHIHPITSMSDSVSQTRQTTDVKLR